MTLDQAKCRVVDSDLVATRNWIPSANFGPRKEGAQIDLLLMHYTATPTNAYALELLTSPEGQVSSHYLIDGEGVIYQLVREEMRAWHAGDACWAGERDINSCSIGIEIQNQGAALVKPPAYGRAQMKAVVALSQDIVKRHNISPWRVLAHSDVAPHRKQDPGAHFDWELLAKKGIGFWVSEEEISKGSLPTELSENTIKDVQLKLQNYGYELELTGELDERSRLVVTAFQRHYRPSQVDGKIDAQTIQILDPPPNPVATLVDRLY